MCEALNAVEGKGGSGGAGESLILLDDVSCSPSTSVDELPPQVLRAVGLSVGPPPHGEGGEGGEGSKSVGGGREDAALGAGGEGAGERGSSSSTSDGGGDGKVGGDGGDGCAVGGPRLVTHTLRLGYSELSAEEALQRILPPHVTVPTGRV